MLLTIPTVLLIGIGFCVLLAILAVVVISMVVKGRESAKNSEDKPVMEQVIEREKKIDKLDPEA